MRYSEKKFKPTIARHTKNSQTWKAPDHPTKEQRIVAYMAFSNGISALALYGQD
jgi:hypothetical protein